MLASLFLPTAAARSRPMSDPEGKFIGMARRDLDRPLVIDLFAGAGGLSLGFEQAGYDIAAAVELDPVHSAVHEYNFPYAATICGDVTTLTGSGIRARSGIGNREVHAVIGGAPCQGFSLIGKRQLDDPRNKLVAEFARVVLEVQPRYFVLENVAGLTVGDHRLLLDEVIAVFERGGYQVLTPYKVLQAADFGVPQSRRRLFLIGARAGVPLPEYPLATHAARTTRGRGPSPAPGMLMGPSVAQAIGDLPDADQYAELLHSDSVGAPSAPGSEYSAVLAGAIADIGDFGRPRVGSPGTLTSSMRTVHTPTSVARFAATEPGTVEAVSRFLRLHPDGIANTLRAGTAADRGAHTSPRPIHPWLPRVITVREAARLHSYPDWFRLHVTKWHGFRQIGNSVPPRLGRAVASELLRADGIEPSPGARIELGDEALLWMTAAQAESHFGIEDRVIPQRRRPSAEAVNA